MAEKQDSKKQGIEQDPFILRLQTGDFIRFLDTVTPNATCPSCGNTSFEVISDGDHCMVLATTMHGPSGERILPCFAVYCDRCGFIRPHSVFPVQKAVAELDAAEAEDGVGD